jgi:hypothetical protein
MKNLPSGLDGLSAGALAQAGLQTLENLMPGLPTFGSFKSNNWKEVIALQNELAAFDELSAAITKTVNARTPEDAQGLFLSCYITFYQS